MADVQGHQQEDQSMEEILQSIRRIIAEENDDPAAQAQPREGEDVLELTEIIDEPAAGPEAAEPVPAAAADEPVAAGGDILSSIDAILRKEETLASGANGKSAANPEKNMPQTARPTMEETVMPSAAIVTEPAMEDSAEELLSSAAAAQAAAALSELRNMPEPQPASTPRASAGLRNGATVEDLVVEALRPMLKEWLDANLPALVRELVEREIRKLRA